MEIFLGWDVGAWHCDRGQSRDALCALARNDSGALSLRNKPWRGNLRETLNTHQGSGLILKLLQLVGAPTGDVVVTIAIDTPLGWPQAFIDLLTEGRIPDSIPRGQSQNKLLFRRTDQYLFRAGHRPLSVVQDMISSQSTKGLFFLERAGLSRTQTGIWSAGTGALRVTAIETYPSPCRNVLERDYQEIIKSESLAEDEKDSIFCVLVAYLFASHPTELLEPDETIPVKEGWIWLPSGCYTPL